MSSLGRTTSVRASATRCCSPPDSVASRARRSPSARPAPAPRRRARGARRRRHAVHAQAELDVAAHVAVREQGVVLEHQPEAAAGGAATPRGRAAPTSIVPLESGSSPATARSSVLLPLPLGPRTATVSPCADLDVDAIDRHPLVVPTTARSRSVQHVDQNADARRTRTRSTATTASADSTMSTVDSAIAAPKLRSPGRPSSR